VPESVNVLVLIGFLVVGALLSLREPADADRELDPLFARRDQVRPMVERGMADLNVFLERHRAFAAYLERRDASSGPPPE
jgi:hypothetical protein